MSKPNRHLLQLAREIRGLTQSQLAQQSGVDQGAISRYESGDKLLTEDVIAILAAALGYPVAFFERDYEPAPMLYIECRRGWVKLDGRKLDGR